ncbi:MAG: DUF6056 family protein [Lachnospiraceae bacterium]|nr:DUF6056 family protein [Lachnospiraceae bacterium]
MKTTLLREILLFIATAIPLSGAVYNEVFYWFSGATYGIFMSLFFLYGGFLFCYYGTREKKYLCLFVIIGTLCCMNLPYSLPVIMLYLTVILKYSKDRKEFFRKLILLVLFICGASVYLLSPGVKRRSELVGSADLSLKNLLIACRNDVTVLLMRAFEIFTRYPIQIYMLLLVFLIGTMGRSKGSASEEKAAGIKKSIRQFVLYLIFGGVAVFGAVYPVVLGYASSSLPNRICFLADTYLMIYLIGVMYLLGCLLKRTLHIKWTRPGYVAAAFLFVVELYTGTVVNERFLLSAPIRIAADLSEIKAEHDAWTGILLEAERSGERDVLIRHSRINDTGVLKSPDLWEDETWWVNRAVGRYMGKDSVKITWSE